MKYNRKFKDPVLQKTYDLFRVLKPELVERHKGSCYTSYCVGRYLNQTRPISERGSLEYAAWAAGVDEYHEMNIMKQRIN